MFLAKMAEAGLFKKIVESIKDIVTVVNFDISGAGISFQAMDVSHVALVSLLITSDAFTEYRADRKTTIGVKLLNLHKILKCADNADMITLECDQEDPQVLNVKFESHKQDKSSKFVLNLVVQDEEQLQLPDTVYAAKITMPAAEFTRIVREMSQLSENIAIRASKRTVNFEVKGDVTTGDIELKANNSDRMADYIGIEAEEGVRNSFALSFLNSFCKASCLSEQVTMSMSANTPIVVDYRIQNSGYLRFYLAPKIEGD